MHLRERIRTIDSRGGGAEGPAGLWYRQLLDILTMFHCFRSQNVGLYVRPMESSSGQCVPQPPAQGGARVLELSSCRPPGRFVVAVTR